MEDAVIYPLSLASVIITMAILWYLFQTVKIMWGYSSLLAIAAVFFSPFVHIVFYLLPKDGFDKGEKLLFKKYFLSLATIAVLGVFAAIAIPAIDNNQYEETLYSDNLNTTEYNTTDDSAAEKHFEAIYQAHPDADDIVDSAKFKNWWQSKPDVERRDYERVLNEGNSSEVIHMLTLFEIETGGI